LFILFQNQALSAAVFAQFHFVNLATKWKATANHERKMTQLFFAHLRNKNIKTITDDVILLLF